jgi:hypothetical protein
MSDADLAKWMGEAERVRKGTLGVPAPLVFADRLVKVIAELQRRRALEPRCKPPGEGSQ